MTDTLPNTFRNLATTVSFWIWIITLVFLVVSVAKDKRRFRNCFYLLFNLGALALFLIIETWGTTAGSIIITVFACFFFFLFLLVPLILIINGFVMIKHEGFRIPNLLSLAFGVFIIAGELAIAMGLGAPDNHGLQFAILTFGNLAFYTCVIFLAFLFYSWFRSWIPKRTTYDYVIVHGCGLINGDQISKILQERIDKGVEVYRRSMSSCKLICSGGKGPDEKISEAEAMKEYMMTRKSVPEHDIILEDGSFNTIQNLQNSKDLIQKRGGRTKIALVTSNFHVLRALIYTKKLNLDCTGIGAHVAAYYWPSAMIREFVALMRDYLHWYICGAVLCELPAWIMMIQYWTA